MEKMRSDMAIPPVGFNSGMEAYNWVIAKGGSGVAMVGASGWDEAFGIFGYLYINHDHFAFARRYWQAYYHPSTPVYGIAPVAGSSKYRYARVFETDPSMQVRQPHEGSRDGTDLLPERKPQGTTTGRGGGGPGAGRSGGSGKQTRGDGSGDAGGGGESGKQTR